MALLIGYARVSTQEQNLALQRDALEAATCERIFVEKASGAQRDRPELKAGIDYMRDGDTLVVWKLDRLARSLKQLIETVEDFGLRGIGLRSITESIDTGTSGGKLIFHVFGALAEFERSVIRERTQAGLKAARARGRVGGRPAVLNDADLTEARALLSNPDISVAQVAKRLGVAESTPVICPADVALLPISLRQHERRRRQSSFATFCLAAPTSGRRRFADRHCADVSCASRHTASVDTILSC